MEQSRLVPETIDRCCTEVHDSATVVSTPFEPNIAQDCMFEESDIFSENSCYLNIGDMANDFIPFHISEDLCAFLLNC